MKDAKFVRIDEDGRHVYQLPGEIHHVDIKIDISEEPEMIEVKTAELIGPALDWSVAKADGIEIDDSRGKELRVDLICKGLQSPWIPSANWYQGGPLIEKYRIELTYDNNARRLNSGYYGYIPRKISYAIKGDSALIAVCRCLVLLKLGDTVSVPRELMQ